MGWVEWVSLALLVLLCLGMYVDMNWGRWRRGEFKWGRRRG
jgi:hypothetical protein